MNNLPEMCFALLPSTKKLILIKQGVDGYVPYKGYDDKTILTDQADVDKRNERMGVTKPQREAMFAGSMFGWDVPAANPDMYDENGRPVPKK